MIELLVSPIALATLFLFFIQGLFHQNNPLTLFLTLIVALLFSIVCFRLSFPKTNLKNKTLNVKQLLYDFGPQVLITMFFLISIAWVISPLFITQTVDGYTFLRFPGIWDYYKHSYVITGINSGGIPPLHPYFPSSNLSYYYGYYLIPAVIAKIFGVAQTTVLFFYVLLTDTLSLIILNWLIRQVIKKTFNRILALSLVFLGAGMDAIPVLTQHLPINHLENWFGGHNTGLIVYNIFTAFLWAPQHIFPTVLALYLIYRLIKKDLSFSLFVLLCVYIFLSSTFIFLTLIFWLGLVFIFFPYQRRLLLFGGLSSLILIIPYFLQLSSHGNILSAYSFAPYPFVSSSSYLNKLLNFTSTLIVEYGLLLFAFPVLAILTIHSERKLLWLFLSTYLPIVITWKVRSGGPNDFGMKTILPVQILLSVAFVYLIDKIPSRLFRSLLLGLTISMISAGLLGFSYEYSLQWKRRYVVDLQTTQLAKAIRRLPPTIVIGSIERGEWVFNIPVLGFRPIYSPSFYDSGVYKSDRDPESGPSYQEIGSNLFVGTTTANSLSELINKRNSYFNNMEQYFNLHPFDILILSNATYVKQGKNIWTQVFNQMGVSSFPITPDYTAYDFLSLVSKLKQYSLTINENQSEKLSAADRKFPLPAGYWFLATCRENLRAIKLDFEDYFEVFVLDGSSPCGGNLFYHPNNEDIRLSNNSTVTEIVAIPIKVSQKPTP